MSKTCTCGLHPGNRSVPHSCAASRPAAPSSAVRLLVYPIAHIAIDTPLSSLWRAEQMLQVPFVPRTWRVLRPQPLQHCEAAVNGRSLAHSFIPRARRVLRPQPLQHGKLAAARRSSAHTRTPWARQVLHPQPLKHCKLARDRGRRGHGARPLRSGGSARLSRLRLRRRHKGGGAVQA